MRLFAAIDIDTETRQRIADVQQRLDEELRLSRAQVKWVDPQQIHLTLKFLGEVPDDTVTRVCDVLTRTAAGFEPFEFEVRGVGLFGRPARIVWAGIVPCPVLNRLQDQLESACDRIGWPRENRPFVGHLTICRVKNVSAARKLQEAVEPIADTYFGNVYAERLVLYQSRLSGKGPEYTVVSTAPLK